MKILSVCLSIRLSVKRVHFNKTEERSVQMCYFLSGQLTDQHPLAHGGLVYKVVNEDNDFRYGGWPYRRGSRTVLNSPFEDIRIPSLARSEYMIRSSFS